MVAKNLRNTTLFLNAWHWQLVAETRAARARVIPAPFMRATVQVEAARAAAASRKYLFNLVKRRSGK
jgi:hypothetical protein